MSQKSFASDNASGIHPKIIEAIIKANIGHAKAYGEDEYTKKSDKKFKEHFGDDIEVYYVFNGTAANVIGLAGITPSYSSIICSDVAHINVSECAAPQRFIGCRLQPMPTTNGKMKLEEIKKCLTGIGDQHLAQPRVISITQPTEYGTVYTQDEIKAICDFAHKNDIFVHIDGARLSNAAVALGLSFKELTKNLGVDVLSFGGTKNGMMYGDAIIFFNKFYEKDFKYIRKQGMQLGSKMRFISCQFETLLTNNLWYENAKHANTMAKLLELELRKIPEIKITQKVETNAVFAILPPQSIHKIQEKYSFYVWDENAFEVRFMTAFDTTEEDITNFVKIITNEIYHLQR